jgi:hypothetical protein
MNPQITPITQINHHRKRTVKHKRFNIQQFHLNLK